MNEYAYYADCAGLFYDIQISRRGFQMSFYGYQVTTCCHRELRDNNEDHAAHDIVVVVDDDNEHVYDNDNDSSNNDSDDNCDGDDEHDHEDNDAGDNRDIHYAVHDVSAFVDDD